MAEFTGTAILSSDEHAVEDDGAANAGMKLDAVEVVDASGYAPDLFAARAEPCSFSMTSGIRTQSANNFRTFAPFQRGIIAERVGSPSRPVGQGGPIPIPSSCRFAQ